MPLTTRKPKRRAPTERPAAPVSPEAASASPGGSSPASARTRAARRGGGPEDQALYSCMCGYVFTASVTTSVACPHCGTEQAW